jgi:hypothetical protein
MTTTTPRTAEQLATAVRRADEDLTSHRALESYRIERIAQLNADIKTQTKSISQTPTDLDARAAAHWRYDVKLALAKAEFDLDVETNELADLRKEIGATEAARSAAQSDLDELRAEQ